MEVNLTNYLWQVCTGIITLPHMSAVEITFRTSQVSNLISFPNSPSLAPLGSRILAEKGLQRIVGIHQSLVAWLGRIYRS